MTDDGLLVRSLQMAVESWKKDEAIWKDTEAELLAKVRELNALATEKADLALHYLARLNHLESAVEQMVPLAKYEELLGKKLVTWCDCGHPITICASCAVEDYQAAHSNCATCCPPPAPPPALDLSWFAKQLVDEPALLCKTCQHPAKNHTLGKCRKKRCGCGGWRG